jgi:hypothetical protein
MSTIMFAIEDRMSANLLESLWRISSMTTILESVIFMKLGHLKGSDILSLGITGLNIESRSLVVTFGNKVSILVLSGSTKGTELGLVNQADQFLLSFGNPFEAFPPIKIKEFVISCIDSTGDGIISRNDGKGFSGNLPIFPLDQYVITRSIPILVFQCEGTLMLNNASKTPSFSRELRRSL